MLKKYLFPQDKIISSAVITLAFPVILSNLSRTLMNMVDVAMVGRLGFTSLAAVGMGAMLVFAIMGFSISLRTATQTLSSRRLGQKKFFECGTALRNGHIMGILLGLPLSLLGYYYSDVIVPLLLDDPEVIRLCVDYSSIAFLSVFFSTVGFVFQGFLTGVERTRIHMQVTIVSNLINVYFNAGFIYGREGIAEFFGSGDWFSVFGHLWTWAPFPELGVKGAALGTLIGSVWMALHYTWYMFLPDLRKKYKVFSFHLDIEMMKKQFFIALPQGVHEMLVMFGFVIFYKIVGLIGILELAAMEIVFTIMHVSFMPGAGIGQGCATLVGKYLGEEKPKKAEKAIKESVRWSIWVMGSFGVLFMLIPEMIIPIWSNDPFVVEIGSVGLRILGIVQFFDAVGITLWFALSGAGNTQFPAVIDVSLNWGLFLPLSYFTGVYLNLGFIGPGLSLAVYICLFAIIMAWKVRKGDWKHIEV